MVDVVELRSVLGSFALVCDLCGHGRSAWAAEGCDLGRLRTCGDASAASVIGDSGVVVDDYGAVVDVGDVYADVIDGAVVVEAVSLPVAAVIAVAGVAEAVVNASIKADVGAPVAVIEAPAVVVPAPVTGGPQCPVVRGSAPGAGDPVVAGGSPVPVARGPDVVRLGGYGLVVDGKGRWWLIGVDDGRTLTFLVKLVVGLGGGLGVLVSLIVWWRGWRWRGLIGWVLWGWLLGSVLRGRLLGLICGVDLGLSCSGGLGFGSRTGHVGVGWIGAGVGGDRGCVDFVMASCETGDGKDCKGKT